MPTPPRLKLETIIVDQHDNQLATIDGMLWPPTDAVIELANPHEEAIVRVVRMRLGRTHASVVVQVAALRNGSGRDAGEGATHR